MAQQRTGMAMPSGIGAPAQEYSSSGQAGGGTGSVFGDLGGPGQQQGDAPWPIQDGPRNAYGHPTGNPSGDFPGALAPPAHDGVFGDLGGSGVAAQLDGPEIPAAPVGTDSGGQGGYR